MNKEEKDDLDHNVRNRLVNIAGFMRSIKKEVREIEKYLDSIGVDRLTEKRGGGIIR